MSGWIRWLTCVACLFPQLSIGQQNFTIRGTVMDANSLETLQAVSIQVNNQPNTGSISNAYGFYSLSLEEGPHSLTFSHVGFQETVVNLNLTKDTLLIVHLRPSQLLEEVTVSGTLRPDHFRSSLMGVNALTTKEIENVPVLFGEPDILKTIQLLPGILSAGEGGTGYFVRGGTADQNLVLLDEATVFNASHLFGFFSTFNSDAIKEANLYKGSMPAQFGGRIASILEVNTIEGNKKDFKAKGGLGLIASRLTLEGPLLKEKGSFMVGARRTYADLFLKLSTDTAVNQSSLYFYDLNAKANYQINERNSLYVSAYLGKDVLGYTSSFNFNYGNATGTLRWNHIYNPKLFSNVALVYGKYNYFVDLYGDFTDFSIASKIENIQIKKSLQYYYNTKNTFKFGVDLIKQKIKPASIFADPESQVNSLLLESRQGLNLAGYLSHSWNVSPLLNVEYGLRMNQFLSLGPGTFNRYDSEGRIIAEREVNSSKVVKNYFNLEPRFSLNYKLNNVASVKFSINRNTQTLHQLSSSTAALPTDVWIMSSENVKPQTAIQGSLGYYRVLEEGRFEFSFEMYYKDMQNQLDLRNGAEIQANPAMEADLLFGKGRAYGTEFYLKKRAGDFTGWVSYTLSRSERKFEALNQGNWFNARQDQTHALSLVGMYTLSPRVSLSSNFVFNTGNAVTFPSGKYQLDGTSVWYYSERNGYRMPNYHRLDVGVTLKSRATSKFDSSWNFGIYNVYNRRNAYLINFRENKRDKQKTEAYKISLFGIVPAVTWNFNF